MQEIHLGTKAAAGAENTKDAMDAADAEDAQDVHLKVGPDPAKFKDSAAGTAKPPPAVPLIWQATCAFDSRPRSC